MLGFARDLRHAYRLVEIVVTLARHDALFPLEQVAGAAFVARTLRLLRRRPAVSQMQRPGQRLAAALQALGPSFIKLGQALSLRADLIGDEVAADLALLQDRLPPFPGAEARATVERELGQPIASLYRSFEAEAVAAASIAQVHLAVTSEGDEVAVKVLRPGIAAAFDRDIALFLWLATLSERLEPRLRRLKPREVVLTLAQSVRLEMDLRFEAAAASELADNFRGDSGFRVPKVYWQRTSHQVLTLERVGGIRVDDRAALAAAGHDPRAILAKAASAFFNQVFRDGFFHADLHPGNLFIDRDGAIVAVDFGIMGRLDRKTRYYLADMLLAFLTGDYVRVAEVHFEAGYVPPHQSRAWFAQACRAIGEPILGRPMHEISLGRLLAQLFQVTEQFEMETQPQLLLLQKTMVVAEGVGRMLDPTVNMWSLARPLIEDWMRENRGPEARIRDAALDALEALERLPALLKSLDKAADLVAEGGGLPLHRDSLAAIGRRSALDRLGPPLWIIALALAAIAISLL
ncbi:MAG TPA: 2-polyprenylphenol 6-hydroxylase [Stellaceae bacterium]|nr:2-polyprenylphenol 6-hydroxylase [Stellaceae bacterium]